MFKKILNNRRENLLKEEYKKEIQKQGILILNEIYKTGVDRIKTLPGSKHEKAILSLRRLYEFLQTLLVRYIKIKEIERELYRWDFRSEELQKRTLDDAQREFVGYTESFNQQLYAVLNAFINLLSIIGGNKVNGMPSVSTSKFLTFAQKNFENIDSEVSTLSKSLDFRAKHIDHTNQGKAQDWMTISGPNGLAFIVYFSGKGRGNTVNIGEKIGIEMQLQAEEVYISPHHQEIIAALFSFTRSIFKGL